MKITKRIAERITLRDDSQETGGISYIGEKLDNFMMETNIPFGTPLNKINEALHECGIEPIEEWEALNADNPYTREEIELLDRLARYTNMDCWFYINEYGVIRDLENKSKVMPRNKAIAQFLDGLIFETFKELDDTEKYTLLQAVKNSLC